MSAILNTPVAIMTIVRGLEAQAADKRRLAEATARLREGLQNIEAFQDEEQERARQADEYTDSDFWRDWQSGKDW